MPETKSEQPLMADAFLIDPRIVSPEDLKALLKAHTRGWPARHCYRGQLIEGRAMMYVTPTAECTLLYSRKGDRRGRSRYAWKDVKPGVQIGVLEDERERAAQAERIAAKIKRGA